jgi:hypothetical protein
MHNEAVITINGMCLSAGESRAIRLALVSFSEILAELGLNDHEGTALADHCQIHVALVRALIEGRETRTQ